MQNRKPIAFINGDGGTGRVAQMVRETIFKNFPTIDKSLSVESRLDSKDTCIDEAGTILNMCGAGFKNSTASDDSRIKEAGLLSANIIMRPMMGAYAMLRLLQGPGRYASACGTLRFASGGIYDEQSCVQKNIDGRNVAVITQHMDLDALVLFAELAVQLAREHGLHLVLSSKSTICASELLFRTTVENIWKEHGLKAGNAEDWSGDFHHELTDMLLARLPVVNTDSDRFGKGGFLHVADNANGDSSSDIIDIQHGNHVMCSRMYCKNSGSKMFTYEELPGGTANRMTTGKLCGENFLNPIGIIFAMASAFEQVNPEDKAFFDAVRSKALEYIDEVPENERDTEEMIRVICMKQPV